MVPVAAEVRVRRREELGGMRRGQNGMRGIVRRKEMEESERRDARGKTVTTMTGITSVGEGQDLDLGRRGDEMRRNVAQLRDTMTDPLIPLRHTVTLDVQDMMTDLPLLHDTMTTIVDVLHLPVALPLLPLLDPIDLMKDRNKTDIRTLTLDLQLPLLPYQQKNKKQLAKQHSKLVWQLCNHPPLPSQVLAQPVSLLSKRLKLRRRRRRIGH